METDGVKVVELGEEHPWAVEWALRYAEAVRDLRAARAAFREAEAAFGAAEYHVENLLEEVAHLGD